MRISKRARYALRLMIDLVCVDDPRSLVNLKKIAERNALSRGYLEHVIISLKNAMLVRGVSGREGGYILARPADEIRLSEIVEAVIGPINVVGCVLFPESCARSPICESRPLWVLMNAKIKETLEQHTLAEFVADDWLEKRSRELAPLVGELAYPEKVIRKLFKGRFPKNGFGGALFLSSGCGFASMEEVPRRTRTRGTGGSRRKPIPAARERK